MSKKKAYALLARLTETEQDLIWHMEHGYQLETDSLSGNPVLRRQKDGEVLCPASANRNTLKALEERGLIGPAEGGEPLTIVWHLKRSHTNSAQLLDQPQAMGTSIQVNPHTVGTPTLRL
jgi:hypothetical protein